MATSRLMPLRGRPGVELGACDEVEVARAIATRVVFIRALSMGVELELSSSGVTRRPLAACCAASKRFWRSDMTPLSARFDAWSRGPAGGVNRGGG